MADLAATLALLVILPAVVLLPALVPAEWFFAMRAGASLASLPSQWRWPPGVLHVVKCMVVLFVPVLLSHDGKQSACVAWPDCEIDPAQYRLREALRAGLFAAPLWVHLALVWYRRSNDNGLAVAMGPAAFFSMGGDRAALGPALLTFCAYLVPAESPLRARVQVGLVTAAAAAFLGLRARFDDLSLATAATVVLVWLPLVAVLGRDPAQARNTVKR